MIGLCSSTFALRYKIKQYLLVRLISNGHQYVTKLERPSLDLLVLGIAQRVAFTASVSEKDVHVAIRAKEDLQYNSSCIDIQTDGQTDGRTDRQTDGRTDGRTGRRTDRQTDIQTDRQTDRQAHTFKHRPIVQTTHSSTAEIAGTITRN